MLVVELSGNAMNHSLLTLLRLLVAASQKIAPRITGRLVFRLFCLVPRGKPPGERERTLLGSALAQFDSGERTNLPFEGGHLTIRHFTAHRSGIPHGNLPRRRIALVHGFASRSMHMAAFIDPLIDAGFDPLLIDLPGHGESSGRTIQLLRAVRALQTVHDATGPWYALVGHSFGGAIATAAISGTLPTEDPIPVERLALISSPEDLRRLFEGFGQTLRLNETSMASMIGMVERIASVSVDAFKGGLQLALPTRPTLVVHATDDREVPVSDADAYATAGDHVRVMRPTGLGHRRILYAPEVIDAITAHLAD